MKKTILALLLFAVSAFGQITVNVGNSYDTINSTIRTYGVWYNPANNFATMPIAVFIHGGAWSGGTAFGINTIAPESCGFANANTAMCGLAAAGYAVYSINYTLVKGGDPTTLWPAQWQDCDCFLKFLAEQAGVSVPGNPQDIHLFGHSAGAHLAGMISLAPHTAFPSNCSHSSTAYAIKAIALLSPPLDLRTLWMGGAVQGGISGLLGCTPQAFATAACVELATSVNPVTYANAQTPLMVESALGDQNVPYQYQGSLQSVMAGFSPPVFIPWNVFPATFGHDLDLFYYNPCSSDPTKGAEPSPCGIAGRAYSTLLSFFQANP